MAFARRKLSVLAYGNGFTVWHYVTTDSRTAVMADGYWDETYDFVRVGDVIYLNAGSGDALETSQIAVIPSPSRTVRVAEMSGTC